MMSSRLRLEAQTLAALQSMSAIQHEPSDSVSEDTAMETKDWNPTPTERHQTFLAKMDQSIRGHACDALDSWLYNNHMTVERFCDLMKTSKNVGSRFGSVSIGNGVFALAILWLLGFRWEVLDTEDGRALTFLPRDKANIRSGACWKTARVECLQSLADALGMQIAVGKKSALSDVLSASPYLVHYHSGEASYLTVELRAKPVFENK